MARTIHIYQGLVLGIIELTTPELMSFKMPYVNDNVNILIFLRLPVFNQDIIKQLVKCFGELKQLIYGDSV